jgi:hypothetical protein
VTIDVGVSNSAGVEVSYVSSGSIGVRNPAGISIGGQSVQLGSLWMPYAVTDSGTQTLDFSIVPTDPEAPWPFVWEGDGYSNSLWLVFTAADTQTLTVTLDTTFDNGIEVWTGAADEDAEELSVLGSGQDTLEVPIAPGQRILMRAHPLSDTETGTGVLTWSVATRTETGILGFVAQSEILETPGWLRVSLLSATPDADVEMSLDGGSTFFTVHTEEDGTFEGSVEVPELTPGAHTITATDVDAQTETETFTVTLEALPPDTIPGNTPPTTGISADPVIHWVLEDVMPTGLGAYEFPINPSEMGNVWPQKQLRVEHTIHGSGQDIIWEGRADPVDWTVKGSVMTQEFYETLEAYKALNRRIYVIDHHQRGWVVAFEGLTFEKKGSPGDDWRYDYTAKFFILGGPVSLT